jgi:integrase
MRRATGFVLKCQGSLLESFARYSDSKRKRCICAQTAINWAATTKSLAARARRLGEVIRFARYMRAEDQRHEVPPPVFGSDSRPRRRPYIFSEDDIQRLIQAASKLGRRNSFRGDTYNTFFSLLVCTGLRLSEAIRLRFEDITPDGLLVRCSKFRKSRLVPLHESARAGLETYLRQRLPFAPLDDHLFVSLSKRPLLAESVQTAFNTVVKEIGLKKGPGLPRLTVHSLRHTFAVRSLQNCPDYQPISDTRELLTRTGIWKQRRN